MAVTLQAASAQIKAVSFSQSSSASSRSIKLQSSLTPKFFASTQPSKAATKPEFSTITAAFDLTEGDEPLVALDPEAVQAAYIRLYGDPKDRLKDDNKVKVKSAVGDEPDGAKKRRGRKKPGEDDDNNSNRGGRQNDGFEDRLVEVRRCTKVVKGGKQLSFRAVVVVGDRKGRVGVGVGKAKEVIIAVQKAGLDARRHLVSVPLTRDLTFPHRADGRFGAAIVMLRPAAIGTGVIAGGSVRVVLELAGIENALGKQIGSGNALNNARAVLDAVSNMKRFEDVCEQRGLTIQELWA